MGRGLGSPSQPRGMTGSLLVGSAGLLVLGAQAVSPRAAHRARKWRRFMWVSFGFDYWLAEFLLIIPPALKLGGACLLSVFVLVYFSRSTH